jgi:HTH-type transcriptional regulator / antitoxin HipB
MIENNILKINNMEKSKLEIFTLEQLKDESLGKIGTPQRDKYENELKLELLGEMIKQVRKDRNLTQEELGKLVGVQKAQISKLERSTKNARLDTIIKVFNALKAKVNFSVELYDGNLEMVSLNNAR